MALCLLGATAGEIRAEARTDPAIFAAPESPIALVQLPNGDRLHVERATGRTVELVSDVPGPVVHATRMLSIDNAGIRGFARYDDTGRLFELARPVEGLASAEVPHGVLQVGADRAGRITHILGPDGQALVFHRDAAGRLNSITTQWGYVALDPKGAPRESWIYPGVRMSWPALPHKSEPPVLRRPNPLQFMSLSNDDRFIRQAFALISANLAKLPPEQAIGDWEAYWTTGRYLTEDPYYSKMIAGLGPVRPIGFWASGEPLKEYVGLQMTLFATLQAQVAFSYLQTVSLGRLGADLGFQVLRNAAHEEYMTHVFSGLPVIAGPERMHGIFRAADDFTDDASSLWDVSVAWRRAFDFSVGLGDDLPEPSRVLRRQAPRIHSPDPVIARRITANDLLLDHDPTATVNGQKFLVKRLDSGLFAATARPTVHAPGIAMPPSASPGFEFEVKGVVRRFGDFTEGPSIYHSYSTAERMLAFWDKALEDTARIFVQEGAELGIEKVLVSTEVEAAETPIPVAGARFVKLTGRDGHGRGGVRISPEFTAGAPGAAAGVRALLNRCDFTTAAACDLKP